jgi:hypothetical protein
VSAIFCACLRTLSVICVGDSIPRLDDCTDTIFQMIGVLSLPVVVAFFVLTVNKKTWTSIFVAHLKIGVVLFGTLYSYLVFRGPYCSFFPPEIFLCFMRAISDWTSFDWTWSIQRVLEIIPSFQFGAAISFLFTSVISFCCGKPTFPLISSVKICF